MPHNIVEHQFGSLGTRVKESYKNESEELLSILKMAMYSNAKLSHYWAIVLRTSLIRRSSS